MRYRILNFEQLQQLAAQVNFSTFVADMFLIWIRNLNLKRAREPHWTESIAVGSQAFVRRIAKQAKTAKAQ